MKTDYQLPAVGSALWAGKPRFVTGESVHAHSLLTHQFSHSDSYSGTTEELVAAGLVLADRMPGQPGCNKVMQYVTDTGEIVQGGSARTRDADIRHITKEAKGRFRLRVNVSSDEELRRREFDHDSAFVDALENGAIDVVKLARDLQVGRADQSLQAFLASLVASDD